MRVPVCVALFLLSFLSVAAKAATDSVQFLSGHGKDDPVRWQFKCDNGQHCNEWSMIAVPSNWELQGFGIYTYGRVPPAGGFPRVHGTYKRTFTTPSTWAGETVFLHFEGVMTDTQVTVNGKSAGALHQGGYYAFRYDITALLKAPGQQNEIQVDVDDDSKDASVNHAERRGDFWNYGGIFRPVYLEAVPRTFIDHVGISAASDGSLKTDVLVSDARTAAPNGSGYAVEMRVLDLQGKVIGHPVLQKVELNQTTQLSTNVASPHLWNAETPNLYQLELRLKRGSTVIHTVHQKFGFRTIELRPGHGLFVNGSRVFLKGVDRHSFWPDSGRTLSEQISREDIQLIKALNGNAVRSSHYAPDRDFLDLCDELGLYVLDELTGWQAHYDTGIGKKLVRELVEHDANHPSILFWDNGNEGGFNFDLDPEYAKYDPQTRVVLHPWAGYPVGIADTKHYPNYETLQQKLAADPVFFPTEMLHGLYDGGAGAGLRDYWDAITKSKAGAGGFIWSFVDEDVKRTDKGDILDSQGNYAPDGIVGPYREKEGSFYAVRQLWSPILVTRSEATANSYTVTNRYSFFNADQCTYEWQSIAFSRPGDQSSGSVVLASRIDHGRSLAPNSSASWDNWGQPAADESRKDAGSRTPDASRLIIKDPMGSVIQTYVWPLDTLQRSLDPDNNTHKAASPASASEAGDRLTLSAGGLSVQISKVTGLLVSASRRGSAFSLSNGPRVVAMDPRIAPPRKPGPQDAPTPPQAALAPDSTLTSLTHAMDGSDVVVSATFDGPMKSLRYRLHPSGWLSVEYTYAMTGPHEYFGMGFDYPEANVQGMRFLGEGPAPVYQNRIDGGTLDVWSRPYNNTMVGDPDDLKPGEHFNYPVFKGFYAGMRWLELTTTQGPITAIIDQSHDSPVYVQLFTPKTPPAKLAGLTAVPFPSAGLSFLHAIPAVGSKFGDPRSTGPMGQPAIAQGEYKGHISLYFGSLRER